MQEENQSKEAESTPTATEEPLSSLQGRLYVNKEEIIKGIAHGEKLVIGDVRKVMDSFLVQLSGAISQGKAIRIQGLGTFQIKTRRARKARNPRTGETFITKEKRVLVFKLSRDLRRLVDPNIK